MTSFLGKAAVLLTSVSVVPEEMGPLAAMSWRIRVLGNPLHLNRYAQAVLDKSKPQVLLRQVVLEQLSPIRRTPPRPAHRVDQVWQCSHKRALGQRL